LRVCRRLNGCQALVVELAEEIKIPTIVAQAVEHRLTTRDLTESDELRRGRDDIRAPKSWADEAGDPR
jgi:hypothetical protein